MILSMTGYGCVSRQIPLILSATGLAQQGAEANNASILLTVELRSVNSRFLDLSFRMPDECRAFEAMLRELLMQSINRGKVECRVQLQRSEAKSSTALDETVLADVQKLSTIVQTHFPQAQGLRMGEILRWPGLLREPQLAQEALQQGLIAGVTEALAQLMGARQREGASLSSLLSNKVAAMLAVTGKLAPLVPELLNRHQQRLTEKLTQAMTSSADLAMKQEEIAERICRELTIYGFRIDIDEELARLNTHLHEVQRLLSSGQSPIGKRLDFMMQELNREANTLGSKAITLELSNVAIELKLLIEQMREQVQNLE